MPGGQAEQAFAISLLQSVTEVLGLKSVSEVGVQTAEYDGTPLSLALQKLEETYLKQSQVSFVYPLWKGMILSTDVQQTMSSKDMVFSLLLYAQ